MVLIGAGTIEDKGDLVDFSTWARLHPENKLSVHKAAAILIQQD